METPLAPLEFARRARKLYPERVAVVDGAHTRGRSEVSTQSLVGLTVNDQTSQNRALAPRLREETALSLKWIAKNLQMGTWTHISNRLYHSVR